MNYRLTEAATQDVRELLRHIQNVQKSPQSAKLVAQRLRAQFRKLVERPKLGHRRDELHDDNALVIAVSGLLVIYDATLKPLTICE